MRLPDSLEYFSLGGVVATCWQPRPVFLPWALTSSGLCVLSFWDVVARSGKIDFILLGLAAYELALGLTEEEKAQETA